MKINYRVLMVASAAFFYVGTASAQWQTPTNTIPVGRGQGTGFGFASPGALGTCLLSNGPASAPSFGACATGSAGISTNTLNAQSANYSIAASDAGKTIYVTGGPFTVTLPGVGGFAPTSVVNVCNGNPNSITGRAVRLSGFPNPIFSRLYMQTCLQVAIENGVWVAKQVPGRFRPAFVPTLYVDTTNGNDANDGYISNASGNALLTFPACTSQFQTEYDFVNGNQPFCSLTAGQTFVGSVGIVGLPVSSSVYNIVGNGGVATIRPTASGNYVFFLGDFAPYLIFSNITIDCTGGSGACQAISMHQQSGIDLNSGTTLRGNAAGHSGVSCDSMCKVNTAGTLTLAGTLGTGLAGSFGSMFNVTAGITYSNGLSIGTMVNLGGGSIMQWSGALVQNTATTVTEYFTVRSASVVCLNSFSVSGSTGGSPRQWSVLSNSLLANLSATAVPGSAGLSSLATWAPGIVPNSGVSAGGC